MKTHHDQVSIRQTASRLVQKILTLTVCTSLLAMAASGCTMQVTGAKTVATKMDTADGKVRAAEDVMEKLIRAYESGEAIAVDPYLDPAMVGAQVLLDSIRDTQAQQKKIRIVLKDVQPAVGTDVVIISAKWEKRYLSVTGMTPKLATGQISFMMNHSAAGWRVNGITGDNIFSAYAKQ